MRSFSFALITLLQLLQGRFAFAGLFDFDWKLPELGKFDLAGLWKAEGEGKNGSDSGSALPGLKGLDFEGLGEKLKSFSFGGFKEDKGEKGKKTKKDDNNEIVCFTGDTATLPTFELPGPIECDDSTGTNANLDAYRAFKATLEPRAIHVLTEPSNATPQQVGIILISPPDNSLCEPDEFEGVAVFNGQSADIIYAAQGYSFDNLVEQTNPGMARSRINIQFTTFDGSVIDGDVLFPCLTFTPGLAIATTDSSVTGIQGFNRLTAVNELRINGMPGLQRVNGFGALESITEGGLSVTDNPFLTDFGFTGGFGIFNETNDFGSGSSSRIFVGSNAVGLQVAPRLDTAIENYLQTPDGMMGAQCYNTGAEGADSCF
uniref:Uncharacterized protein n=1 Tax=Chromera velia CCMP2878 TaxID=1169474 RepID=A0A0G4GQD8_9ALVE|mmetsp:Transcript_47557/g.93849  ORF Transcript_47557/g.93849 Transcript_47557/m.93849 type:complete len:374 (+) Transcript_47557:188-1309(+)|eukprot:Cvel_22915.t1-p1 / transcript=Cvel_22915.t1 / gene=Cvel_22915 / organism=Chromera_velia_CCMP2878 / gene_product=hypothetical protein / transcript_product=hypothetical protein / location=Cvel_scaffold2303:5677-10609(+) / protein_length=373 / sequence_SO=supercontig / SO=protein_coding / is_pseudo=false